MLLALGGTGLRKADAQSGVQPRRRIVIGLPRYHRDDEAGRIVLQPNVRISGPASPMPSANAPSIAPLFSESVLPGPDTTPGPILGTALQTPPAPAAAAPDSLFQHVADGIPEPQTIVAGDDDFGEWDDCDACDPWHQLFAFKLFKTSTDIGIGHERVMFAPLQLDTMPLNSARIQFNDYARMVTPDRAQYFWTAFGKGPPLPERSLDYQEVRFVLETGGDRFSVVNEIPIRILDPANNNNTAGLSDISIGPKVVLVDGKRWKLAHIFRTFAKTGAASKGLSSGHVSLEPGLLLRYQWTPDTFLHGELKFRFPIAGDPAFSGPVLQYGLGISTILYETDSFAMLPTLEFLAWSVLDGQKSRPDGSIVGVDGEQFGAVFPGMRFVLGPSGDLGLFELGLGGGFSMANNGFFETHFRLDLRFSY